MMGWLMAEIPEKAVPPRQLKEIHHLQGNIRVAIKPTKPSNGPPSMGYFEWKCKLHLVFIPKRCRNDICAVERSIALR